MNDQTRLERIIASIKGVIEKLIRRIKGKSRKRKQERLFKDSNALREAFKRTANALSSFGDAFKIKKGPRKLKSATKNHNQKRNKVRANMARESNRINRIRVKGWKH